MHGKRTSSIRMLDFEKLIGTHTHACMKRKYCAKYELSSVFNGVRNGAIKIKVVRENVLKNAKDE